MGDTNSNKLTENLAADARVVDLFNIKLNLVLHFNIYEATNKLLYLSQHFKSSSSDT